MYVLSVLTNKWSHYSSWTKISTHSVSPNTLANPPTYQDFQAFFLTLTPAQSQSMVFWSGVDEAAARDFAKTLGRNTLEMLIGDRWAEFQKHVAKGGSRWHSWKEAVAGFWDLAAAACAEFATGEVYVYMTREAMDEQTHPACQKCWYREEKPRLIRGLNNGRISRIVKYIAPWRVGKPSIGKITAMNE